MWQVVSKGIFNPKNFVSIDDVVIYLNRQKRNCRDEAQLRLIEHLVSEFKKANLAK